MHEPAPDAEGLRELTERAMALLDVQPLEARELAERGRNLANRLEDRSSLAYCLYVLGSSRLADGMYEHAESELRAALDLSQVLRDQSLMVKVLRRLLMCAFYTKNPDAALLRGMQALQIARDIGDRTSEALTHNDLGLVYGRLGDMEGALEHLLAGLRIMQEDGSARLGSLLNNIGNVYLELGDNREALSFFQRSLQPLRDEGAKRYEGVALGNVGRAHAALGNDVEALKAFRESLDLHVANDDAAYLAPALARMGTSLGKLGREEEAREYFRRALEAVDGSSEAEFGDEVHAAAGRFHLSRRETEAAIERLGEALRLIPPDEETRRVEELHEALSEAFEQKGDLESALRHFRTFHHIHHAVTDASTTMRIRGLMLQFDVERSRQQEEIIRLRNVELLQANEDLQTLHEQLTEQNRELHQISIEDALTRLYNRRYLDLQLGVEIARSRRHLRPLCVAMCDVDHFKEVNDRHSHAVGDDVLRTIAHILREAARITDVIARFGGEEFLLILPDTDLVGAEAFAERIREAVADHPWEQVSAGLRITLSIGVAELRETMETVSLLAAADARLYDAKRAGRDRVVA